MGVRLIRFSKRNISSGVGGSNTGSGNGTFDHDELLNRDMLNQHPIYAITGLQEVINTLEDADYEISKLIVDYKQKVEDAVTDLANTKQILDDTIASIDGTYATVQSLQDAIDYRFVPTHTEDDYLKAAENIGGAFYKVDISNAYCVTFSTGWASYTTSPTGYGGDESTYYEVFTESGRRVQRIKTLTSSRTGTWTFNVYCTKYQDDSDTVGVSYIFPGQQTWYGGSSGGVYSNIQFDIPEFTSFEHYYGEPCYLVVFSNGTPSITITPIVLDHYEVTIEENDLEQSIQTKINTAYEAAHSHDNKNFLDKLSINNNIIQYDGVNVNIPLSTAANNSLKYNTNGYFVDGFRISTVANNGIVKQSDGSYWVDKFNISTNANNALTKETNGYYVKKFLISSATGNMIQELQDGYYVPNKANAHTVIQNNHNLLVGQFIYFHPDDGYKPALATDEYDVNAVGMVTAIIDANTFEYQNTGFINTTLFNVANGFTQGMPLYLSDITPGSVTQVQPDISKVVGYPVENAGIMISLERGIEYNKTTSLGDFKISANDYNVRSDGFIRIVEDIDYKYTFMEELLDILSDEFKEKYISINEQVVKFINTEELYDKQHVPEGLNLFIKAFDIDVVGTGTFEELKAQNALLREEISQLSKVFDLINREVIE